MSEEALGAALRVTMQSNLMQHFNPENGSLKFRLAHHDPLDFPLCFRMDYNSAWLSSLKPEILLMVDVCYLNF